MRSLLHGSVLSFCACAAPAPTVSTMTQWHHAPGYTELSAPDLETTRRFYTGAFGWAFTDYGPEYAGICVDGQEVGGIRLDAEAPRTAPLPVLYSADLESTLASVEGAGGTIVRPIFSFPGGRRFHFTDPAGNELAVWSDR